VRNLYSLMPKRDDIGRFFHVSHNASVAFDPVNRNLSSPLSHL